MDRELKSVNEVHIAPLGYEYERILRPAIEHNVDVLYLLRGRSISDTDYHDQLLEDLTENGITVKSRVVNISDIYDVLGEVTTIIHEREDDIVRINVSSGPKLAAVGAALATMATDASGYHVHPKSNLHPIDEIPLTEGMEMAEVLPSYPMETPTEDQVRILNYISESTTEVHTPKKSDLIEFSEKEDLDFIAEANPANSKAKFALINNRIIDPLIEASYIRIKAVGRQKQVTITETGENALRAFRHLL